jgi:hypothetical protein
MQSPRRPPTLATNDVLEKIWWIRFGRNLQTKLLSGPIFKFLQNFVMNINCLLLSYNPRLMSIIDINLCLIVVFKGCSGLDEILWPRVTRLCALDLLGRFFIFGSFFCKFQKQPQIFWVLLYTAISTKNGLGYILADFFTNSSGHLDFVQNFMLKKFVRNFFFSRNGESWNGDLVIRSSLTMWVANESLTYTLSQSKLSRAYE